MEKLPDGLEPARRILYASMANILERLEMGPYFLSQCSRLGRGWLNMRLGDLICILYSIDTSFVLHYENRSDVANLIRGACLEVCMHLRKMPNKGR